VEVGAVLGLTGVGLVVLAALNNSGADPAYQAVCVDTAKDTRISDNECQNRVGNRYVWWYLKSGTHAPPIGGHIDGSNGSFAAPHQGKVRLGGVPADGGTIGDDGDGGTKGRAPRGPEEPIGPVGGRRGR
jgi:hypothetical protein